jgi:hypothetical protein
MVSAFPHHLISVSLILFILKCWSSFFIPAEKTVPCCETNSGNGTDASKSGLNKRAIHCAGNPAAKSARQKSLSVIVDQKEII